MPELVRIQIVDQNVPPEPAGGVLVRVADPTTGALVTQELTDNDGLVEFLLPGGTPPESYELRFFAWGVATPRRQLIEVYDPPAGSPTGTNDFLVTVETLSEIPSPNPFMCRASGYVRRPDGSPASGITMVFTYRFSPLIVQNQLVTGDKTNILTDENGFVSIDLFRGAIYGVTLSGHSNVVRDVTVPELGAVNINRLVFPVVRQIEWDPAPTLNVAEGDTLEVTPTITTSAGVVLEGSAHKDVIYSVDDTTIASVRWDHSTVYLRGVAPGTTTLRVRRIDESIQYLPDPGIDGSEAEVSVS